MAAFICAMVLCHCPCARARTWIERLPDPQGECSICLAASPAFHRFKNRECFIASMSGGHFKFPPGHLRVLLQIFIDLNLAFLRWRRERLRSVHEGDSFMFRLSGPDVWTRSA
ncbi:hypothetical protein [Xanthomonas bundabergensis]|uniref:hypothetical protein n=1 Tax=Xanthomonas bundabergensis TaxID=3160842 RepID=UPI0035135234